VKSSVTRKARLQERWSGASACFELADGGTLLLDEIGEMPPGTQAKLLRVLEDSKVRRLGSKSEISVDVRVLAATNKVPEEAVALGQLRSDLYFRLNVVRVAMPPLRDHLDDLPDFGGGAPRRPEPQNTGRSVKSISPEALENLAPVYLAGGMCASSAMPWNAPW